MNYMEVNPKIAKRWRLCPQTPLPPAPVYVRLLEIVQALSPIEHILVDADA